jgi:ferric-dicitrate binding protein FerR (iron transport regulator)
MIVKNTEKILQRYLEGNVSQEEREEVVRWIAAKEENRQKFLSLRRTYDAILMSDWKIPAKKSVGLVYDLLKIAAVFLIFFGCYHLLFPEKQDHFVVQTIRVPQGQRAELTLADGTDVWLNANSVLSFPDGLSGRERKVQLNGEGYFKVAHDASRKFIIQTEQYEVNVLGTEFNVKAYRQDHQFETSLIEGSVEIFSKQTGEKMQLTPNQRVYSENGRLALSILPDYDSFLWKEGIMTFEHESIKDILDKLQLYYDVRIDVQNKEIPAVSFSGKFRTKDGVEHALKVLQLHLPFKYVKDNESNTIVIY